MKRLISAVLLAAMPLAGFAANYTFSSTNSALTSMSHGTAVTWGLTGTSYTNLFNDINTGNKVVTSATLTLTNIWDWANETNDPADALFINILGGLDTGIKSKIFDSLGAGRTQDLTWANAINPFVDKPLTNGDWNDILQGGTPLNFTDAQSGSLLKSASNVTKTGTPVDVTWSDPSGGAARGFNLVLNFTSANLAVLNALIDADASSSSGPTVGLGFAAECHYYMSGASLSITTTDIPKSVPDATGTFAALLLGMTTLFGVRRFATKA